MKSSAPFCYLRFLHALPCPWSLDLYLDEQLIVKDLLYEDFTPYKPFPDQEHILTICRHRQTEPLSSQKLWLSANKTYTLCLYPLNDTVQEVQFLLINEPYKKIPEEHFLAQAINLSLYCEPLKCHFIDTKPEYKKLLPGHFTSYLAFAPDSYHLELFDPTLKKVLFHQENLLLKPSRYYAFYILGGNASYPLKVISALEGNSIYHFDLEQPHK